MPPTARDRTALPSWRVQAALTDLAGIVRFLSRLPVPRLGAGDDPARLPDFRHAGALLPLAGAVIALPAALTAAVVAASDLPALLAGGLVAAAGLLATGALHEDGLADTADGIGAGGGAERRLAAMKDSRIGGFGAAALAMVLILRAAAIGAVLAAGPLAAALAVLAAGAASRVPLVLVWAFVPTARPGGLADQAGQPSERAAVVAALLGAGLAALALPAAGLGGVALGLLLGLVAGMVLARYARKTLGGQTGDVLGATQQVGEIGFYVGLLA
ncbi:adenosylcobinamide-GDP ribazoletransferase [Mongoliimonas terrestris]|uniref:adenosylcobinamide-GDP ribazoletransferase n=1 Tax=Mongoliimonas terrestris TaxID=1709001 RepID=UPI000AC07375|nr:adenosylcobinamide-GDP ribazoletransferase [Mongoliimonas terrestris]